MIRNCGNCKYVELNMDDKPCRDCNSVSKDKWESKEQIDENTYCDDCKYRDVSVFEEPCSNCTSEDFKWEPQEENQKNRHCDNCKYHDRAVTEEPCFHCDAINHPGFEPAEQPDSINHPSHYEVNGYECIEVMKAVFGEEAVKHFCLCNAFKYLWRFNWKNGDEDLGKAKRYLEFYLEMTTNEDKTIDGK